MEIQIPTPDDINRQITESIAASAIGEQLKKIVDEQVQALGRSYDNPMKGVVDNFIRSEIASLLSSEFREPIREKIRERLTDERVDKLFADAFKQRGW